MSAVERMAQAIERTLEHSPEPSKKVWEECARAALSALAEPEGMEEAAKALRERFLRRIGKTEVAPWPMLMGIQKDEWLDAAKTAAPLLLAKPLAENELLRVALGAANDDREAAHERLARLTEAGRKVAESMACNCGGKPDCDWHAFARALQEDK